MLYICRRIYYGEQRLFFTLMKTNRLSFLGISILFCALLSAQTVVHISDPDTWKADDLSPYVGQTVTFDAPFYITNNYYFTSNSYYISSRRIYSPTNQELPASAEYNALVNRNNTGSVRLTDVSAYHRMGERIENLTVKVNSTSSVQFVSGNFVGNKRQDLEAGIPSVDLLGEHTLLVCAFNLEYYLVENLGTGYGPDNQTQHNMQKQKIGKALDKIRADIFGFVEIEQGQSALQELAQMLTEITGKTYSYIDDGGSASGSYTKSGYVYCTETVEPYGKIQENNVGVQNRKKMQGFQERSTGERFIFSINHFKAKSGTGTGLNADQGDGQGTFNQTRVQEAQSVLTDYTSNKSYYGDADILIMGDLNAYAKEDPITTLIEGNGVAELRMTDLHRYFHKDSAYSYVFRGAAGYLDHALANSTLLKQVTGVAAYHINSDEDDRYTYDGKNNDGTMFRCSDHDPVLVGLHLGTSNTDLPGVNVETNANNIMISNAEGGYYIVSNLAGYFITQGDISNNTYKIDYPLHSGFYIVTVYANGRAQAYKLMVL